MSLLRLGLEQIDSGERSGPGRLSVAGLSLDEEGEHKLEGPTIVFSCKYGSVASISSRSNNSSFCLKDTKNV